MGRIHDIKANEDSQRSFNMVKPNTQACMYYAHHYPLIKANHALMTNNWYRTKQPPIYYPLYIRVNAYISHLPNLLSLIRFRI